MTKTRLRYIGKHQPKEIVEVNNGDAKKLVESGNYEYLWNKDKGNTQNKKIFEPEGKKSVKPSK